MKLALREKRKERLGSGRLSPQAMRRGQPGVKRQQHQRRACSQTKGRPGRKGHCEGLGQRWRPWGPLPPTCVSGPGFPHGRPAQAIGTWTHPLLDFTLHQTSFFILRVLTRIDNILFCLERTVRQFPVSPFHKIEYIFKNQISERVWFFKNSLHPPYSSDCVSDQKHICAS